MFNVNGEIRVVGITVLHGRFRGYRCHVADYQVKSAIVRALGRIGGATASTALGADRRPDGRVANELCRCGIGFMPAQSRHASYRWYVLPPDVSRAAAARLPGVVAGLEYSALTRTATW